MKKIFSLLAVLGTVLSLSAAEAKLLRIPVGSLSVVDVPFKVENVSISNKEIVRVETLSDRQVRINGLKIGVTDVQLLGSNMSQVYSVTVINDIRETFNALKRDLSDVSEIDLTINNGRIVLRGEINNISNWILKRKVTAVYGSVILDLTTYHPTPEVMLSLQKNFEKAGFKIVRKDAATKPGELAITQIGEMLTVTGSVYNPADLKTIDSILRAQPWLTLNTSATSTDAALVKGFVNVQVVPEMLQIDVVHVTVDRTDMEKIGINWTEFVNGGFGLNTDLLYKVIKNYGSPTIKNNSKASFGIGSNGELSAWLSFFGSNGINRTRRAGFLTFKSNDTPEFRKLHSGGTLYLSPGANPGGSVELKDIDYGLILQVKGGLSGADNVAIELKQEISYPGPKGLYAQAAEIDVKKFTNTTSVVCKLGETVAIGGLKEFIQEGTDSAGIPYLRNIPGLKWLFAEDSDTFTESQVLTLICVRKMAKSSAIDPVAVELDKMKKAEDRQIKEREANKHKNDGKWYEFWRW
ncbi:MAG: pilus assembly protein N-terminal domain-containing protein [Lentisphaeria bacterium]|nr:pilus assembly protein N-terminal domain-containing protein [Lentisphaeria bacterium]